MTMVSEMKKKPKKQIDFNASDFVKFIEDNNKKLFREISDDSKRLKIISDMDNLIMAHRYLYYVKATPVISDFEYDKLERKAKTIIPSHHFINLVGSDRDCDYPEWVKKMALDLLNGEIK